MRREIIIIIVIIIIIIIIIIAVQDKLTPTNFLLYVKFY